MLEIGQQATRLVSVPKDELRAMSLGIKPEGLGIVLKDRMLWVEFARRRPRLTGRLSRVAEKLAGRAMKLQPDDGLRSSLSIGPGFRRYSGISSKFARRFAEGIGKLARRPLEEDQKTRHKNTGGYRISGS
ncbi:hypothetical protein GW17_00059510 [Ensete ventricosum]|nr:hypothetical protein GW17_00059510 [Ensete ventricosum]